MSCDGPGLAETFANRLKLKDCTISYIGSNADMPQWGQLGCNGFIVLNASHSVVCRATSAYMQLGPAPAFRHVETLLAALLDKEGSVLPPTITPGQVVQIDGLKSRADLNGSLAVCLQGPEGDAEARCAVQLPNGTALRIKMSNLTVVADAGAASGPCGGDGPCGQPCGEAAREEEEEACVGGS